MNLPQRARALFDRAIDLPADAATRFLDESCKGDAELRVEVNALLAADRADTLRALQTVTPEARFASAGRAGDAIGHFRLIRTLGEGGFGVVWLAEQTEPVRREVALKVIKIGMDTQQVLARFEAERQTLAMMNHPNVARVFDGGATEQGRPWFAMECVFGQSITEYCDANRLDILQRLRLFLDVCGAISHAHQKGVIHRDIKPSNVLVETVDGHAVVKVIDFGIAKAIEASAAGLTAHTQAGQLVGTPDYMSPEQADASQDIDTRSDIYALGVLLYELLTGGTPLRAGGVRPADISETLRAVRENEAPRPSTRLARLGAGLVEIAQRRSAAPGRLQSLIRGDLDWIVMKTLEKDRARRFETTSALAADIERFLRDEPVAARPPSRVYRLRKLVKRNRMAVSAAGIVLMSILGGLVGISIALARAERSRTEAVSAREQAEALNLFLVEDLLRAADPARGGHKITVVEATANALQRVGTRFSTRPETEALIRTAIGGLYNSLGMINESAEQLELAVRMYRERVGPEAYDTLVAELTLADTLETMNRLEEAERTAREVRAIGTRQLGANHGLVLRAAGILGEVLQKQGRHAEAEPLLRDTLARLRSIPDAEQIRIPVTMGSLAACLNAQGKQEEAVPLYREVLDDARARYPRSHPAVLAATHNMATVLANLTRYDEALPLQEDLLQVMRETLPAGHWQIAMVELSYGVTLRKLQRDADARPHLQQAYETTLAALGAEHFITERSLTELLIVLRNLHDGEQLRYQRLAVEARLRIANEAEGASVNEAVGELERLLGQRGDGDAATAAQRMLEETAEAMVAGQHPRTQQSLFNLGRALLERKRYEDAERWLTKSYEIAASGGGATIRGEHVARMLAELSERSGQNEKAAAWRLKLNAATRPAERN